MKVMIDRNGETQEITGWRRWAIVIPVIAVVALVLAAAVVFVLGLTLTVGVVLIVALPAAVILALLARMVMNRDSGGGSRPPA